MVNCLGAGGGECRLKVKEEASTKLSIKGNEGTVDISITAE